MDTNADAGISLKSTLDKFEQLLEKNKQHMYAMAWSEFRVLYRELRKLEEEMEEERKAGG